MVDKFQNGVENVACRTCFDIPMISDENCTGSPDYNTPIDYGRLNEFLQGRGMKLLHQNVNGLLTKIYQIRVMLEETNKNVYIFGITETHANKDLNNDQLCVNGHTLVRRHRESGHGGGVC